MQKGVEIHGEESHPAFYIIERMNCSFCAELRDIYVLCEHVCRTEHKMPFLVFSRH